MFRGFHVPGAIVSAVFVFAAGCRTPGEGDLPLAGDLSALIAEAGRMTQEGAVARKTAALALENALAAQDEAERLLVAAMRDSGLNDIQLAREKLARAREAADATLDVMDDVVRLVLEAAEAAAILRVSTEDVPTLSSARVTACMLNCREAVLNAKALADDLKQKWLVADLTGESLSADKPPETR